MKGIYNPSLINLSQKKTKIIDLLVHSADLFNFIDEFELRR